MPQELPKVPFGQNASRGQMEAACPNRDYQRCFIDALYERYPQHNLFMDKRPLASAPENARQLLPNCRHGDATGANADSQKWTGRRTAAVSNVCRVWVGARTATGAGSAT